MKTVLKLLRKELMIWVVQDCSGKEEIKEIKNLRFKKVYQKRTKESELHISELKQAIKVLSQHGN